MKKLAVALLMLFLFNNGLNAEEWTPEQIEVMAQNAEQTVQKAYNFFWQYRLDHSIADEQRDPRHTGVIGTEYTALTTTIGYEDAKELSTQKGWASWLVRDLAKRGLWERAKVAVSFSGSFPGLNIAVLAALQEINANVKGICSVGSSSWGANEIGLSFPEMERMLREEGILKTGCSAVTLGGTGDRGAEWNEYAMDLALNAVKRSRLPLLQAFNLRDAIKKRLQFYGNQAKYVCYINVGGNHAVFGGGKKVRYNHGGWYFEAPPEKGEPEGVMDAFLHKEIPCLNFLYLDRMSEANKIFSEKNK